ncbi:beta strand repeat-containing protein [Lacunisphaera limnophila]|uniref:beta strand repeat-containing protein n=1 Tax=Lacunisphaera limnophila TaxID=1838286 RepID=UPI00147267B5|nr:autotransporter-associated beta strand repeat-containing protein [Lacunisphaera limnophila]
MLLLLILSSSLSAQSTLYWDLNGTTSGAGSTPTGTWSSATSNWNSSFWGTSSTVKWTSGSNAVFSAGFDATNAYTVTVSGTQNLSSLTVSMGQPTFTGGTLNFNDTSPDIWTISGSTATINSAITGTNGLTKSGAGTLYLGGSAKTYTGTTTVSAGTVQLNASNILADTTALSVETDGTFSLDWGVSETIGSLSGSGTVNFRTGTFTTGNSANTTFSGTLEDSYGTFVKQGTGTLTLSGANTYSGVTTINAGAIVAASNTALGSSTYGNSIASGAALHLQGGIAVTEGQFSVAGTGVGGTGAIRNLSGNNSLDAALDLTSNTTISADAGTLTASGQVNLGANTLTVSGAGNTTLSGSITNSGALTKTGTGTLALTGSSANSFGGALNLNSGTVALGKTAGTVALAGSAINIGDGAGAASSAVLRLDASNQIADYAGLITVNTDGVLQVNNFTESINTIGGTGLIDLSTSGYLTVGINSGSSTFGGSIAGTGTLEKAGAGTLTFTSDIAIAGTLTLSGGTLALSNADLSAGTLLVTGNSIIDFGGTSSLDITNLTISAGVTLTIQNWATATDYFFTQFWTGATFNTAGSSPMNQVVFSGFSGNNTSWHAYDNQITPVPEPATYGAGLLACLVATTLIRRRLALRRR